MAIYDENLERCRFSSFLSHGTALTWSAAEPSHRFVTGFSHRSVIFLGEGVRAAPGSGRQRPSAEAPAVTESQRWRVPPDGVRRLPNRARGLVPVLSGQRRPQNTQFWLGSASGLAGYDQFSTACGRRAGPPFPAAASGSPIRPAMVVPRPGRESTWQEPPSAASRSDMFRSPDPAAGAAVAAGSKPGPSSVPVNRTCPPSSARLTRTADPGAV